MTVSEVCAVFEVLCSVSGGHLLNPAIAQFLASRILVNKDAHMKHMSHILLNGDALSVLHISHLSKQRHAYETRVSHLTKRRHALWRRVSPLLNMQKKNTYRLFSTGFSLH
jgi:hypothetical protein